MVSVASANNEDSPGDRTGESKQAHLLGDGFFGCDEFSATHGGAICANRDRYGEYSQHPIDDGFSSQLLKSCLNSRDISHLLSLRSDIGEFEGLFPNLAQPYSPESSGAGPTRINYGNRRSLRQYYDGNKAEPA